MSEKRENENKEYIKVRLDHDTDGTKHPLMFRTEDGPAVKIDKVIDVREAASLKAGGQGTRYVCLAEGHVYVIFNDGDYWFWEK